MIPQQKTQWVSGQGEISPPHTPLNTLYPMVIHVGHFVCCISIRSSLVIKVAILLVYTPVNHRISPYITYVHHISPMKSQSKSSHFQYVSLKKNKSHMFPFKTLRYSIFNPYFLVFVFFKRRFSMRKLFHKAPPWPRMARGSPHRGLLRGALGWAGGQLCLHRGGHLGVLQRLQRGFGDGKMGWEIVGKVGN